MACNLIMNDSGLLRATQFSASIVYPIENVNFYIPHTKAHDNQVFLVMRNEKNLHEIVELQMATFNAQNGNNLLYKLPINQDLRLNNEMVIVYLMLLNKETGEYLCSNEMTLKISTDHYKLARKVCIAQQVSQEIQDLYIKVLSLTKENKELYNKIKEGETNNESYL